MEFKKYFFWSLLILYSLLIFYLSSLPLPSPQYKGISLDKLIHVGEFFVYAALCFFAFKTSFFRRRLIPNIYAAFIWSSVYAASDELHQYFTGFRFGSWIDFIGDFIGILLFFILAYFVLFRPKGFKSTKRDLRR